MNKSNNKTLDWVKTHWAQILIGIIVLLLILSILKVISTIINGTGPIPKGIGKALGAGANLINGVTNNCSTQADCSKSTEKESCANLQGCGWNTPSQADKKATCINTTGKKTGQGGFFSLTCGLGLGFLVYLGATLLAPLAGLMIKAFSKPKENVAINSELTGRSTGDVTRDIYEKSEEAAAEVVDEAEKQNGGELEDTRIESIAQKTTNRISHNEAIKAVNGQSNLSPEEEAAKKAEIAKNTAKAEEEAQQEAEKAEISEEDQASDDANIDDNIPLEE